MKVSEAFVKSTKPHILMITNHGIHQWDIIPGLPDTGGQNVFVNQFSSALAKIGFRITIINRGGYNHPISGEERTGFHYKDEDQRIYYVEDGVDSFIRKEDMDDQIPALVNNLREMLDDEKSTIDLIISHYWDGAKLGVLYNLTRSKPVKHIWVPHSLGAVKKENISSEKWTDLRIEERIEIEKQLVTQVNHVTATSSIIKRSLVDDYDYIDEPLFLPPCVDTQRYHPRALKNTDPIWDFLAEKVGITGSELQNRILITEISRTDSTKRKDVLIKAFSLVKEKYPEAFLVTTIDATNKELSDELNALIESLQLSRDVAVLGSVWEQLPSIYAATEIYCTPSVMEGFGMTPQEAAATKVPVISSDLVPYVNEYLLGDERKREKDKGMVVGEGAIVAEADDVEMFAHAMLYLIQNPEVRTAMAENAYRLTIPYFTWDNMVQVFLNESNVVLD